ncbi:hypothetical protein [Vibrio sp.]|uniref:hypothetical protein n=1 Tax=Vibrio sp. TaxID=678 RepID=UPI003D11E8CE
MRISEIKKGMWLECDQGVGRVLVVDEQSDSVLLEPRHSHEQLALRADEVHDDPQLHNGCDQYY